MRILRLVVLSIVVLLASQACKPRRSNTNLSAAETQDDRARIEEILRDLAQIDLTAKVLKYIPPLSADKEEGVAAAPGGLVPAPTSCSSAEAFNADPQWASPRVVELVKKLDSSHMLVSARALAVLADVGATHNMICIREFVAEHLDGAFEVKQAERLKGLKDAGGNRPELKYCGSFTDCGFSAQQLVIIAKALPDIRSPERGQDAKEDTGAEPGSGIVKSVSDGPIVSMFELLAVDLEYVNIDTASKAILRYQIGSLRAVTDFYRISQVTARVNRGRPLTFDNETLTKMKAVRERFLELANDPNRKYQIETYASEYGQEQGYRNVVYRDVIRHDVLRTTSKSSTDGDLEIDLNALTDDQQAWLVYFADEIVRTTSVQKDVNIAHTLYATRLLEKDPENWISSLKTRVVKSQRQGLAALKQRIKAAKGAEAAIDPLIEDEFDVDSPDAFPLTPRQMFLAMAFYFDREVHMPYREMFRSGADWALTQMSKSEKPRVAIFAMAMSAEYRAVEEQINSYVQEMSGDPDQAEDAQESAQTKGLRATFKRLFEFEVELSRKFPDFQSTFALLDDFQRTMQDRAAAHAQLINWAVEYEKRLQEIPFESARGLAQLNDAVGDFFDTGDRFKKQNLLNKLDESTGPALGAWLTIVCVDRHIAAGGMNLKNYEFFLDFNYKVKDHSCGVAKSLVDIKSKAYRAGFSMATEAQQKRVWQRFKQKTHIVVLLAVTIATPLASRLVYSAGVCLRLIQVGKVAMTAVDAAMSVRLIATVVRLAYESIVFAVLEKYISKGVFGGMDLIFGTNMEELTAIELLPGEDNTTWASYINREGGGLVHGMFIFWLIPRFKGVGSGLAYLFTPGQVSSRLMARGFASFGSGVALFTAMPYAEEQWHKVWAGGQQEKDAVRQFEHEIFQRIYGQDIYDHFVGAAVMEAGFSAMHVVHGAAEYEGPSANPLKLSKYLRQKVRLISGQGAERNYMEDLGISRDALDPRYEANAENYIDTAFKYAEASLSPGAIANRRQQGEAISDGMEAEMLSRYKRAKEARDHLKDKATRNAFLELWAKDRKGADLAAKLKDVREGDWDASVSPYAEEGADFYRAWKVPAIMARRIDTLASEMAGNIERSNYMQDLGVPRRLMMTNVPAETVSKVLDAKIALARRLWGPEAVAQKRAANLMTDVDARLTSDALSRAEAAYRVLKSPASRTKFVESWAKDSFRAGEGADKWLEDVRQDDWDYWQFAREAKEG